jgi:hypothetical protein
MVVITLTVSVVGCGGSPSATSSATSTTSSAAASVATQSTSSTPSRSMSASGTSPARTQAVARGWVPLPAAPVPGLTTVTGVWDGKELLIVGEATSTRSDSAEVRTGYAAAYDPVRRSWRRLATPSGARQSVEGTPHAVWTGSEMLVWGGNFADAYRPATNRWRRLPIPHNPADVYLPDGNGSAMVWTGTSLVMYGGGCCGGALAAAASFTPVTDRWRLLDTSLLGARWTSGAWTGTEAVIAGGSGPAEPGTPTHGPGEIVRLRRSAAYRPANGSWRMLPPLPTPIDGTALWDGSDVLLIGQGGGAAWSPSTNRWRMLPAGFDQRIGSGMVWTGRQVLIWGGEAPAAGGAGLRPPSHGLAFTPTTRTWSALPMSPLRGRSGPVVVWTGSQMLVWGGSGRSDGAVYVP